MAASYEAFEQAPREVQDHYLSRMSPQERADFERGYEEYSVRQGGEAAKEVNAPAKPTNNTAASVTSTAGGNYLANSIGGNSAAESTASTLAQNEAQNAAYNAGADAATAEAGTGVASNFGSMGAGPQAGIVAGTYVSALDAKNLLEGKQDNSTAGKAGRAQNAINSGGLSEVGRAFGFGSPGRDYGKEARDRISKLRESGAIREDQFDGYGTWDKASEDGGKSVKDAYKEISTKGTGKDIWGIPAFYERFGADYEGKMSEEERFDIAQEVLDSGAFITKDHGLDVDWKKYDEWKENNPDGIDTSAGYQAYLDSKPQEATTEEPQNTNSSSQEQSAQQVNRPQRQPTQEVAPPVLNDIPIAPPPKPAIKTPQEYADAYNTIYQANSVGSVPTGNSYLRRY